MTAYSGPDEVARQRLIRNSVNPYKIYIYILVLYGNQNAVVTEVFNVVSFYVSVRSLIWWSVYLFVRWSEAVQPSRDIFLPIRFFAQHANGDPENLPKSRVVAVIFGFPSFAFNELSLPSIPMV